MTHLLDPSATLPCGFRYRKIMERAALLRLDVACPDHLAPLLGFVGDQLAKVGGREGEQGATETFGEPRLELRIGETSVDLAVELGDDFGRRVPGRTNAIPCARLVALHELAHGREVRQRL